MKFLLEIKKLILLSEGFDKKPQRVYQLIYVSLRLLTFYLQRYLEDDRLELHRVYKIRKPKQIEKKVTFEESNQKPL